MRRAAWWALLCIFIPTVQWQSPGQEKTPVAICPPGSFWSEESRIVASLFPSDANVKGFFQSSSKTRYKNEIPCPGCVGWRGHSLLLATLCCHCLYRPFCDVKENREYVSSGLWHSFLISLVQSLCQFIRQPLQLRGVLFDESFRAISCQLRLDFWKPGEAMRSLPLGVGRYVAGIVHRPSAMSRRYIGCLT